MKIAVTGGGPAGVFCAIKLLEYSKNINEFPSITIFDKGNILSTLLVTGNGRCNLAYNEYDYKELASFYPRGEKFLYSIFSRYGLFETLSDFGKIGVKTYVQDDLRIFPESNKASFVKQKMLEAVFNKVEFKKEEIKEPVKNYDAVVLATGLKAGYCLAQKYGHKIIPVRPALCGLKIKEKKFLKLKGISFNNVIFTDYGISGPYVFKLSSINAYKNFPYEIKTPLIDKEKLTKALAENSKKRFKTVVSYFIPSSLAEILIETEKQAANVSNKEIEELEFLTLTAEGRCNKGEMVHAGGVSLDEVDKNLKSKIVPDLWIIGELLDIDGFTGGFNLQNCWLTSAIAAKDIINKLYP